MQHTSLIIFPATGWEMYHLESTSLSVWLLKHEILLGNLARLPATSRLVRQQLLAFFIYLLAPHFLLSLVHTTYTIKQKYMRFSLISPSSRYRSSCSSHRMMLTNTMRREEIGKEQNRLIVTFPLLAVRGHLCFRCLSHSAKLSKCGGCMRAMYCGKRCQKYDWEIQHKSHCEILRAVNEVEAQEEVEHRSCSEWKRLIVSVKHYVS